MTNACDGRPNSPLFDLVDDCRISPFNVLSALAKAKRFVPRKEDLRNGRLDPSGQSVIRKPDDDKSQLPLGKSFLSMSLISWLIQLCRGAGSLFAENGHTERHSSLILAWLINWVSQWSNSISQQTWYCRPLCWARWSITYRFRRWLWSRSFSTLIAFKFIDHVFKLNDDFQNIDAINNALAMLWRKSLVRINSGNHDDVKLKEIGNVKLKKIENSCGPHTLSLFINLTAATADIVTVPH